MLWWRLCLLITDFDGIVAHAPLLGTAGDALMGVPGVLNSHIKGNLQWRSEMTTWYFRADETCRVTPEKHLWEAMCSEYQQKATHQRVFVKSQARRSWTGQHEVPEKTWEWPQGWHSRSKQPIVSFQKATGSQELVSYSKGLGGGVVLCCGYLLEGTDWKSKYAFHLYKTGLHPPPICPLMQ